MTVLPCIRVSAAAALLVSGQAFAAMDDAAANAAMGKGGCNACHAVAKKIVGPSFADIAKKYKGDPAAVATLSAQVRKGGAGKWGTVPMPPSPPDKISDADLKAVVEWILTK
ncbi:MAG: c-type cytochrome [Sterolibacteriaceae bacterium]|uniref:C-type cytochrome n=1 Tax=Candidatus Methylophosphatis roskildensis TaxID=2899263 RepID=A0A9D7HLE9_9PROT|nr:c-type cytochrome [Candidatus Methylophosphatis roskildensis]MBK7234661.1 c-type cytochrome [Sterolibacteriaceae bacterium]